MSNMGEYCVSQCSVNMCKKNDPCFGTERASGVTTVYRNTSPILTWSMLTKKKGKKLNVFMKFRLKTKFSSKNETFFQICKRDGGVQKTWSSSSSYLFFLSIFFFFNTIPETPLGLRPRFARNNFL